MSKYTVSCTKKSLASRYYHPVLLLPTHCSQGGITELPQSYLRVTLELPTSAYRLAIALV